MYFLLKDINILWLVVINGYLLDFTGDFELKIKSGEFTDSQIIVMLGENGTGKTTFIKMLAGHMKPDAGGELDGCLLLIYMLQIC